MPMPGTSSTSPVNRLWPKEGITKGDLIGYYRDIAPIMLPYLADRPQVLHRHVDGHEGKEFFQRVSRKCPKWLPVVRDRASGVNFHVLKGSKGEFELFLVRRKEPEPAATVNDFVKILFEAVQRLQTRKS